MSVDYAAWLDNADNNAHRNLLADVSPYSGGSVVTRYLSLQRCPAAGSYMPFITGIPTIAEEIRQPWGGSAFATVGDIRFENIDGYLDDWLYDSWTDRDAVLRFGDRRWSKGDYRVIHAGRVKSLTADSDGTLVMRLADLHSRFDRPIQLNTVDDGTNGEVEIPLCYGHCYQVRPILIDGTLHQYQVHDGQVEDCHTAVQLFVDGDHNSVPAFTEDNSTGILDLNADPAGVMTTDTQGAKPSGSYKTMPGEIIRLIASSQAGISDPGEIDTTAFSNFDAGQPAIGLYIHSPTRTIQVFDEIAESICAWYTTDDDGKLTIGQLVAPTSGDSILDLRMSRGHIVGPIVVYPQDQPPRYKTRLGYARAWTINTSTNPNINPEHREWFRRGYKVAEYEDPDASTIQTTHLHAEAPEVRPTLITYQGDAEDQAEREQGLFGTQRYFCEVPASLVAMSAKIGSVITVYDDQFERYGFAGGKPVTVVGRDRRLGENQVNLLGWF